MQKRIELLQDEFEIISKMNEGTIIKIVIPVENIPTREDFDYE
jgi:signal transduction histidine kinase